MDRRTLVAWFVFDVLLPVIVVTGLVGAVLFLIYVCILRGLQ